MNDPVREYLQERGCGEHLIAGGLAGLVASWEQIVESVAQGYPLGLDDYLNDMDLRQLLADVWPQASAAQQQEFASRVAAADASIRSYLQPAEECLWGEEVAAEEGWTR
ncbi:MAG TPA: hypothetical protein VFZ34_30205, partial [Blastocatellia bacterium]|nr:hypothetical protein [Blastocatellia bacterium]